MNWLEGFIYGLISGLTELLPVSSQAHQRILLQLFGENATAPISNLIVHIAMAVALYFGNRRYISRLIREQKAIARRKRRGGAGDVRSVYDLRLIRGAIFPLLIFMLGLIFTRSWVTNLLIVAGFSVINGIIIFVSERVPHGNKDSRHVALVDAIAFGFFGALSVFPGISRVGASQAYATMRGVDRQQSINWAMILSIPALLMLCVFDVVAIASVGRTAVTLPIILGYITAGIGAFAGVYVCLILLRKAVNRLNMASFAYYSWGIALFTLVLYLIS